MTETVAVIYLRTAAQNAAAIEEQRQVCLQYAATRGWSVLKCIEEDGVSGTGDREGLVTLRKIVRERCADVLVTLDATRISRDMGMYAEFTRVCDDHGVRIAFAGGRPAPSDFISLLADQTAVERVKFASRRRNRQLGHAVS